MFKVKIDCNIHTATFTRESAIAGESGYQDPLPETALGLVPGVYTFSYVYPLSRVAVFMHELTAETTNIQVLELGGKDYEAIYAAEDAATGPTGDIPGTLNRKSSSGPYGIWGHCLEDLYFEGVNIDTEKKRVEFSMGS